MYLSSFSNKTASRKPKQSRMAFRENLAGWLFASPLIVGLLLFTLVPMACSLFWSFFDYDGLTTQTFVGFAEYAKVFTDKSMAQVVINTLEYTLISIPVNLILSYLLALLVNNSRRSTKVFRIFYYLPCVIPAVVNGLLWKDITDNTYGIFNQLLVSIGLPKFTFFSEASTSMFSLLLMNVWGIGGGMILWLSAFKGIPNTLYEAATIDGANRWQKFLHITIPMSSPIIFFNLVTSVIGTLQYNGTLVIAQRGGRGVDDSLYLYGVKIYWEAFQRGQIGYACALSWLLCLVISVLTFVLFKTSKWVFYGENV